MHNTGNERRMSPSLSSSLSSKRSLFDKKAEAHCPSLRRIHTMCQRQPNLTCVSAGQYLCARSQEAASEKGAHARVLFPSLWARLCIFAVSCMHVCALAIGLPLLLFLCLSVPDDVQLPKPESLLLMRVLLC